MNINIALNTIIYIMVFLFPGILFRKFYFFGKFSNQFGQGNLLERFLWTLFFSIICLSGTCLFFYFIAEYLGFHLLDNISFEQIIDVFKSLAENQFPNSFSDKENLIKFALLILIIYIMSSIFGFLCFKIIRITSLDTSSAIFRFNNNWYYLTQAHKENRVLIKFGDVYTTYVDVLTKLNGKEELYRGELHKLILDQQNKLETVIIFDTYRFIAIDRNEENESKINSISQSIEKNENYFFYYKEYEGKVVYKKSIEGNLFIVPSENIINLNFTYLKDHNKLEIYGAALIKILIFLFFTVITLLIIFPFLEFKISYFESISKKLVFSFATIIALTSILTLIERWLGISRKNKTSMRTYLFSVVTLVIPYLWIFDVLTATITILFYVISFIGLSVNMSKQK